jgi:glycosyltransferase involved in cell wall biosynthesis
MIVAFDAHNVAAKRTGDETYSVNLLHELARMPREQQYRVYITDPGATDMLPPDGPGFRTKLIRPAHRVLRIPFGLPLHCLVDKADLLHVQYVAPPLQPCPFVLTVHDVSFLRHPEFFSRFDRLWMKRLVPRSIRRAEKVLTVSEFSRSEIIDTLGVPEEKVVAVHNGVSDDYQPISERAAIESCLGRYGIDGPYILYVGNLQPRKNLPRLLAAYYELCADGIADYRLVIVGRRAWMYTEIFASAGAAPPGANVVFTDYVPETDKILLYCGATVCAYPSLYEGFGLPIVESMACGTPVITSNRTSMPEVAGDAAILVDPTATSEIREALAKVLDSTTLQQELSTRGLARAKSYRWSEVARVTSSVYESCLG